MLPILLLLALSMAQTTMAGSFTPPSFYKGLEGPKYKVVKQIADNIELRSYEPSQWVSIKREGMDVDASMSGSFMSLFGYISGANDQKAKIEMTAPVLTKIEPGQGPACNSAFTMSFYQPWKYQGTAAGPKPTDASVTLTALPALEVYVLSFGGFANTAIHKAKAMELMQKLDQLKLPYDAKMWFTAGYDSPYTLTNRRNEIWVLAAQPAAAAKPAATVKAASGHKL